MATFIPQVQDVLPQIESFKPDYDFINRWQEVKQGRYNTAIKELNSIYSTLKNLPLTVDENMAKRDQFFQTTDARIKALANTDLSLPENQTAAKLIFNPLATDKALVEDYGITNNAISVMRTAESLKSSSDKETQARYNENSIIYAGLKLEEYKNASPERRTQIAKQGIKYVDNVNIMERATAIADEMDLDVTTMEPSPGGGYYNIKKRNGELITGSLLSAFNGRLMSDPFVKDYYRQLGYITVQGELQSRAKEIGYDAAQAEMIQKYVTNPEVEARKRQMTEETKATAVELKQRAAEKEKLAKQRGIVPGTDEEADWKQLLQYIDAAEQSVTAVEAVAGPGTYNPTLENAYAYVSGARLNEDIYTAAETLSMRNAEMTYEADPYKKMQVEHSYALDMERVRNQNAMDRIVLKWQLDNSIGEGAGANGLAGSPEVNQNISSTVDTKDEEGNTITEPYKAQQRNLAIAEEGLVEKQVAFITEVYDQLKAAGLKADEINPAKLVGEGLTPAEGKKLLTSMLTLAEKKLQQNLIANNLPASNAMRLRQDYMLLNQRISAAEMELNQDFKKAVEGAALDKDTPETDAYYRRLMFDASGNLVGENAFVAAAKQASAYKKEAGNISTWDVVSSWLANMGYAMASYNTAGMSKNPGPISSKDTSEANAEKNLREYYRDTVKEGFRRYNMGSSDDVRTKIDMDATNFKGAGSYNSYALKYNFMSSKKPRPGNSTSQELLTQIYRAQQASIDGKNAAVINGGLNSNGRPNGGLEDNNADAAAALSFLYSQVRERGNRTDAQDAPAFDIQILKDAYESDGTKYSTAEITFGSSWLGANKVTARSPNRAIASNVENKISIIIPSDQLNIPGRSSSGITLYNAIQSGDEIPIVYPGVIDATVRKSGMGMTAQGRFYTYNPRTGKTEVGSSFNTTVGGNDQYLTPDMVENYYHYIWQQIAQQEADNHALRQQHRDDAGVKP